MRATRRGVVSLLPLPASCITGAMWEETHPIMKTGGIVARKGSAGTPLTPEGAERPLPCEAVSIKVQIPAISAGLAQTAETSAAGRANANLAGADAGAGKTQGSGNGFGRVAFGDTQLPRCGSFSCPRAGCPALHSSLAAAALRCRAGWCAAARQETDSVSVPMRVDYPRHATALSN